LEGQRRLATLAGLDIISGSDDKLTSGRSTQMATDEAVLAKLAQILERLEALESIRTEHVTIEGGTVHIQTGEHGPINVAHSEGVSIKGRRRVTIYVGGDLNGEVRTKSGKLKLKCKGDLNGEVKTADGKVRIKSKGDIKFQVDPSELVTE
jgi:autotransporter translocation and assembly factor TamB